MQIVDGHTLERIPVARELFREYAATLGHDLCFQQFDRELAELPGSYAPPRGRLLLARDAETWIGCVALRPLAAAVVADGTAPHVIAAAGAASCSTPCTAAAPDGALAAVPTTTGGAAACEMKRMFVRPGVRRNGVGRALALALIDQARAIGYTCMRLDTLHTMTAAVKLYESLGFRRIAAYYHNPIPGAVYLELPLGHPSAY